MANYKICLYKFHIQIFEKINLDACPALLFIYNESINIIIRLSYSTWYITLYFKYILFVALDENQSTVNVMDSLSEIQITEPDKQNVRKKSFLKQMNPIKLHRSVKVIDIDGCHHISCSTSNRVWASDNRNNLILTDITGDTIRHLKDLFSGLYSDYGVHTENSESEPIYIDMDYNIKKLSNIMKTTITLLKKTTSQWRPRCVYSSKLTGDLLVGVFRTDPCTGKVNRYNRIGHLTQTLLKDNKGQEMYREPRYLTENKNGDVVVSDYTAVVVTEPRGRHRFSYTGHPLGTGLRTCGICTDTLSNILLCDDRTHTVQIIDKDGQFILHLLTESKNIIEPWSLSYNVNTHLLWVGSRKNNQICVYMYKPVDALESVKLINLLKSYYLQVISCFSDEHYLFTCSYNFTANLTGYRLKFKTMLIGKNIANEYTNNDHC